MDLRLRRPIVDSSNGRKAAVITKVEEERIIRIRTIRMLMINIIIRDRRLATGRRLEERMADQPTDIQPNIQAMLADHAIETTAIMM